MTLKRIVSFQGDADQLRQALIGVLNSRIDNVPLTKSTNVGKARKDGEVSAYEDFRRFLTDLVVHPGPAVVPPTRPTESDGDDDAFSDAAFGWKGGRK